MQLSFDGINTILPNIALKLNLFSLTSKCFNHLNSNHSQISFQTKQKQWNWCNKMELIPSKARCAELKTSFSAIWLSRWSSSTSRCSARTSLCSLCSTSAPPFFLLLLLLASTCSEATVEVDGRRKGEAPEMVALGGGFNMLQEASPWGKMVENMMAGSQISLHKHQWKIILA